MKKFLIVSVLAALIVPAASLGGPTGQDRENAARACRARAQLGVELFRQTYGTVQSNRRNAFGKCVSQWTRTEHQNRLSARAACSARSRPMRTSRPRTTARRSPSSTAPARTTGTPSASASPRRRRPVRTRRARTP